MRCKFYALQFFRTKNKSNSQFSDFEKQGCDKVFLVTGKVTVGKEHILIDGKNIIQFFIKLQI